MKTISRFAALAACSLIATILPLSGILKSAVFEYVENMRPFPGTSKIGSAEQLCSSNQYGCTGVSCFPLE